MGKTVIKDMEMPWGHNPSEPIMVRPRVVKTYPHGVDGAPIVQIVLQPVEVISIKDIEKYG